MNEFWLEKKYHLRHPDGWGYMIQEGDDINMITIYYEELENGLWFRKDVLIENMWIECLPKLVEVLNDIIKDKLNVN